MRLTCLVILASALPVAAETITQQEREFLLNHLERTRQLVLNSLKGVSDAQLNFKAGPERWSIGECAEHIAVAEPFLRNLTTEKVMKAPPGELKSTGPAGDERLLKMLVDRSQKAQAPEPAKPTGRFATKADVIAALDQDRDKTVAYVKSTQEDMRSHVVKHPLGAMDAYQFLLLLSAHSERHTLQIAEVKQDPNYPKR